jgi:hypothetical protein
VPSNEAVELLRSIDKSLKMLVAIAQKRQTSTMPVNGSAIAPDSDLDSAFGNPAIKAADPRDWPGPSMKGKRYSECPPAYLELLANRYDYFATQAEINGTVTSSGKPKAPYDRREAARCRGWAQRLKNGWKPPAADTDFASSDWPDDAASF